MIYIIKFMDGSTLKITEEDFKSLLDKKGLVAIKSAGEVINMSSISRIVPYHKSDELEDKKNQKEGMLHDGTLVIRHFGSWYLDGDFDDKGNPWRRIDSEYYPEVQRDCVPTRKTFELKYKQLPRKERLELIISGTEEPRTGGIEKISNHLNVKRITKK